MVRFPAPSVASTEMVLAPADNVIYVAPDGDIVAECGTRRGGQAIDPHTRDAGSAIPPSVASP